MEADLVLFLGHLQCQERLTADRLPRAAGVRDEGFERELGLLHRRAQCELDIGEAAPKSASLALVASVAARRRL